MTLNSTWKLQSTLLVIIAVTLFQHIQGQSEPQKSAVTKVDSGTPSDQSISDKATATNVDTQTANETKITDNTKLTQGTEKAEDAKSKTTTGTKPTRPIKPKRRRRPVRRRRPRKRQQRPKPKARTPTAKQVTENKTNKKKQAALPPKAEKLTQQDKKQGLVEESTNKNTSPQVAKISEPNKQATEGSPPNKEPPKQGTKPKEPSNNSNKQTTGVSSQNETPSKKDTTLMKSNNKPIVKAAVPPSQDSKPSKQDTKLTGPNNKPIVKASDPTSHNNKPLNQDTKLTAPNNKPVLKAPEPASQKAPEPASQKAPEPASQKAPEPTSQKATEVSSQNEKPPKKDAKATNPKANLLNKKRNRAVESADSFFDNIAFEATSTTESPDVPPPDFNPNPKPKKKTIPVVDTINSKAHDGTACNVTYQPHETDPTKYMMRLPEDVWVAVNCPPNRSTGLVWRQDLCSCGEELVAQDPDDWCGQMGFNEHLTNKHKYIRRHHGVDAMMDCAASLVWSQKECLCYFDSSSADKPMVKKVDFVCKTILNLTFEHDLRNTEGYYVRPVPLGRKSKISRIRYVKTQGSNNLAAQIIGQPLEFLAFKGNDFQKHVTYSLNFKVSPRRRKSENFMALLSDACHKTKKWEPSIDVSFQPMTNSFKLVFRTDKNVVDTVITGAKPNKSGWYKTVVYFQDETLTLENNGQKLFTQNELPGKIPPNRCPLYIAGRGGGTRDKKGSFYGYMDNVFLMKDCKFLDANIKIL